MYLTDLVPLNWRIAPPGTVSLFQDDSTGEMMFDEVFHALSRCLAGLTKPFKVPGTDLVFQPEIFVTILAYSSIIGLKSHQVIFKEFRQCALMLLVIFPHPVLL